MKVLAKALVLALALSTTTHANNAREYAKNFMDSLNSGYELGVSYSFCSGGARDNVHLTYGEARLKDLYDYNSRSCTLVFNKYWYSDRDKLSSGRIEENYNKRTEYTVPFKRIIQNEISLSSYTATDCNGNTERIYSVKVNTGNTSKMIAYKEFPGNPRRHVHKRFKQTFRDDYTNEHSFVFRDEYSARDFMANLKNLVEACK